MREVVLTNTGTLVSLNQIFFNVENQINNNSRWAKKNVALYNRQYQPTRKF